MKELVCPVGPLSALIRRKGASRHVRRELFFSFRQFSALCFVCLRHAPPVGIHNCCPKMPGIVAFLVCFLSAAFHGWRAL